MRSEMCLLLEQQGVEVEVHHHEVAAPGQCEIGTKFTTLTKRADWLQILSTRCGNVAASYGKTATFMPKPVVGDNGSGMHVHQSIWNGGTNLFAGNGYAGLSDFRALLHRRRHQTRQALNAITNPGTNSYKRLVPGFEAPIQPCLLGAQSFGFDATFPYVSNPKGRRSKCGFPIRRPIPTWRFSDAYWPGSMVWKNKIHPAKPMDKNLYDL
jgi:glutamine synthetase